MTKKLFFALTVFLTASFLNNIYAAIITVNDNVIGDGWNQVYYSPCWAYNNTRPTAYLGDDHWSLGTNDFFEVKFYGEGIEYYAAKDNNCGIAAISVDGGAETNYDLYSAVRLDNTLIASFSGLATGEHTLKVRLTGTRNASSSANTVTADRFIITQDQVLPTPTASMIPTVINNTSTGTGVNQFNFNTTWSSYASQPGAYQQDFNYNYGTNNSYEVLFNGTKIKIYAAMDPRYGIAAISIDGGPETTFDMYRDYRCDQVKIFESGFLTSGLHSAKVRITGTKNAASTNYIVNADRVDIYDYPAATMTPTCSGGIVRGVRAISPGAGEYSSVTAALVTASACDIIEVRSDLTEVITISKNIRELRGDNPSTLRKITTAGNSNITLSVTSGVTQPMVVKDLNIDHTTGSSRNLDIPSFGAGGRILFYNVKFTRGVATGTVVGCVAPVEEQQLSFERCVFSGGATLFQSLSTFPNSFTFKNCLFTGGATAGINLTAAGTNYVAKVYNCTFHNCGGSANGEGALRVNARGFFRNNIFTNNARDIDIFGLNGKKEDFYNNAFETEISTGYPAGNNNIFGIISTNEYVDEAFPNFNLKSGAQSRNSGIAIPGLTEDIAGASRPQENYFDIGAYEYVPAAGTPTDTPTGTPTATPTATSNCVAVIRDVCVPVGNCTYSTVAAALAAAQPCDIVELRSDMTEKVVINKPIAGFRGNNASARWKLNWTGNNNTESLTLDAGITGTILVKDLIVDHSSGSGLTMKLNGYGATGKIFFENVKFQHNTVAPNIIINDAAGPVAAGQLNFNRCEITGQGSTGISSGNTTAGGLTIKNTLFNSLTYGLYMRTTTPNYAVQLYNNTINNCTMAGLYIDTKGYIENNLFTANFADVNFFGTNTLRDDFYNNGFANLGAAGFFPENANIFGIVPGNEYVNEASDFHLKGTAQSVNSGKTISGVTEDITGTARPQQSAYDIGAYEFYPTPTLTNTPVDTYTPTNTFTVTNSPTVTNTPTETATVAPCDPDNLDAELAVAGTFVSGEDWKLYDNWWYYADACASLIWDNTIKHGGTYSFGLDDSGCNAAGVYVVQNLCGIDTSATYEFSAWVQTQTLGETDTNAYIALEPYDSAGAASAAAVASADVYSYGAWTKYTISIGPGQYGATFDHLRLVLGNVGGTNAQTCTVWFDDMTFTKISGGATATQTGTPTDTATSTSTFTVTSTPTDTFTNTVTDTATITNTPTDTYTNTATITNTPTNTFTDTATITNTPTETFTNTATITNTPTDTFTITNTPTNTFTDTATITNTPTDTLTDTATITNTPTDTFTITNTPTDTFTDTATITNTPTDTFTDTATITNTPTDTFTITNTPTDTFTNTATITNTPTDTATDTATNTPTITDTFTNTITNTPTDTATDTPTNTPTITDTFTNTITNTPTDTATDTATYTPTVTDTFTNTITSTPTDTATDTPTNTPTVTDTFTNTITSTPTDTATDTPTNTPTVTDTFTNTITNTPTDTATDTPTNTPTVTDTFTDTATNTPTVTDTFTDTATNTPTVTDTFTDTATNTPTVTETFANTITNTPTDTYTATLTNTESRTPTPSFTPTDTATDTATNSATASSTGTPTWTPTVTDTFTNTITNTPTDTATDTATNSATASSTGTPTWTPTVTDTFTDTATNSATASSTGTPTWTPTVTDTFTNTITNTPTDTATDTATNTPTVTDTFTDTATNSATASSTGTPTWTPTVTDTFTYTATNTPTVTETFTNTVTDTPVDTQTPTATQTFTPAVFAYILPSSAVAGDSAMFDYWVSSRGFGPVTQLNITLPTGIAGVAGVTSGISGANVNVTASEIIITYPSGWNAFSNPNFDVVRFSAQLQPGTNYFGSFLNNIADASGLTPSGYTQFVNAATASPSFTATATASYTATHTATDTSTATSTATFTLSFTQTDTPVYSYTPTSTITETPVFSYTPTDTATDTPTSTVTATDTAVVPGISAAFDSAAAITVSAGQAVVEIGEMTFRNTGITIESVQYLTVTVKDESGNPANASALISSLQIRNSAGTVIGSASLIPASDKVLVQLNTALILAGAGQQAVKIAADIAAATFSARFYVGIASAADVNSSAAISAETGYAFPLDSGLITMQLQAQPVVVSYYDLMPSAVSTGQKDVYTIVYSLEKTGSAAYADAVLNGVTITVKDAGDVNIPANTAIEKISIRDASKIYYTSSSVPSTASIACLFSQPLTVTAGSAKSLYVVVDVISNTVARASTFKTGVNTQASFWFADANSGAAAASQAKTGYSYPMYSSDTYIQNHAKELNITHGDTVPAHVSTDQENVRAMNLVFANAGNTATASSMVTRFYFYIKDSSGATVSPAGFIKAIRLTSEDGATLYGEAVSFGSDKITINLSAPIVVSSYAPVTAAVKIDVAAAYNPSAFRVVLNSSDDVYAVDANMFKPVAVTDPLLFPKNSSLTYMEEKLSTVTVTDFDPLLPAGVMKGQRRVEAIAFGVANPMGPLSADALFGGVTVTVKSASGALLAANSAVEKFYAVDGNGVTLAVVSTEADPYAYINFNAPVPVGAGTAKYVTIYADILPTAAAASFKLSVENVAMTDITDENSGTAPLKTAVPLMPWETAASYIYTAPATDLLVSHNGAIVPTRIGMGQPHVKFMSVDFFNPGSPGTADIVIQGLTLTVVDTAGAALAAASFFTGAQITNQTEDESYSSVDTAALTTAAPFYAPFIKPLYVEASNTKTVYIAADISLSVPLGSFKLRILDDTCVIRSSVPSGYVTVTAAGSDSFPMDSGVTTVTALAYDFRVSHTGLMPVSAAQGQDGIEALALYFENLNVIPINVTSVAFTVKDASGNPISAESVLKDFRVTDASGNIIGSAVPGTSSMLNVALAGFDVAVNATLGMKAVIAISDAAAGAFYIEFVSPSDANTVPLASVNPAAGDYFGNMKSGTVSVQVKTLADSFHLFPNPCNPSSRPVTIEYYLEADSEVTLKIFSIDGKLVKKAAGPALRSAGLNSTDTWDGKNEANFGVKSGIYLCVIEAKETASGKAVRLVKKFTVLR